LSEQCTEARHWRKARTFGLDLNVVDNLFIGRQGIHDEGTRQEDKGFEGKSKSLVKHYILALAAGEVKRMKTATEVLNDLEVGEDNDDDHKI